MPCLLLHILNPVDYYAGLAKADELVMNSIYLDYLVAVLSEARVGWKQDDSQYTYYKSNAWSLLASAGLTELVRQL
jgi:hypothetical protein